MNIKQNLTLILALTALLASCINDGGSSSGNANTFIDPDPVTEEGIVLPSPAEDLYIIGNVDGTIIGFDSANPTEYSTIAEGASTEKHFANVRLSPDKTLVLYAKENSGQKDLTLLNINSGNEIVISENIHSNESEFIDNERIHYVNGGHIYFYDITSATSYNIVPHQTDRCNHWPQISPSLDKIVYKDQNASGLQSSSLTSWSPVAFYDTTYVCNDIFPHEATDNDNLFDLYDSFEYNWRDNDFIIFKALPGLTNKLREKNIDNTYSTTGEFNIGSTPCTFEHALISPNKEDLLLFGSNGVYMVDLTSIDRLSGDIEPVEVYYSTEIITRFAALGSESQSFVVATDKWVGIYNSSPVQKTNFAIGDIYGDSATLYAIHCR